MPTAGECYKGRVAHVSKLGAFVLLDELAVEELIPFRAIRDQLGRLSVLPYALVSDATGKRLSMGDEVPSSCLEWTKSWSY